MRHLAAAIALVGSLAAPLSGEPMKDLDRQQLLAHFEMTDRWLVSELNGLTPAQLKFQMTPESWSIAQVVEHLAIAEPQYWQTLLNSMKQPAATDKAATTDAAILWYGIDRTQRDKTGDARVPKGKYAEVKDALADVRKLREAMKTYAGSTQEDLRAHRVGGSDAYQWFLMISTHSQRHILQILEIKAHANYPKS